MRENRIFAILVLFGASLIFYIVIPNCVPLWKELTASIVMFLGGGIYINLWYNHLIKKQ